MKQARPNLVFAGLLLILILGLLPSPGSAFSNPLIRVCHNEGGRFQVERVGSDDIALCRLGSAVIDAQTLLSKLSGVFSLASDVVLQDRIAMTCTGVAASELVISSRETLCLFTDGSALNLDVVRAGLSDSDRLHLKEVLSRR